MNDKIAIYLRLSLADGDLKKGSKDESNSIENQRMLLHDYIGKQEDLFGEIISEKDSLLYFYVGFQNLYLASCARSTVRLLHPVSSITSFFRSIPAIGPCSFRRAMMDSLASCCDGSSGIGLSAINSL